MPVSIIGNTAASYAQSAITSRNNAISLSTQRISSGTRVTSAGDDAAALAVGTSLKIENAGLGTAILNATSGNSMLQIVDGAMGQLSDIMIRLKTIATEASSDHLDDTSRQLANSEFSTLIQEIDRIASTTTFNDASLLTGSKDYQANAPASSADGISGIRFDQNVLTSDGVFRYSYDKVSEKLTLERLDDDGSVADAQSVDLTGLLDAAAGKGQNLSGGKLLEVGFSQLGVTLTLGAGFNRGTDIAAGVTAATGANISVATPALTTTSANMSVDTVTALGAVATATPAAYDPTTGKLTLTLNSDGTNVTLAAIPGISYVVNGVATASGAASGALDPTANTIQVLVDLPNGAGTQDLGSVTTGAVATTAAGTGTLSVGVGSGLLAVKDSGAIAPKFLSYKVGIGVVAGQDTIAVQVPAMTLEALGLKDPVTGVITDVSTAFKADAAIDILGRALTTLNTGRATVGAQQTRMESVISNLGVVTENNEAARSSLMDVDVSKEISDLTTNQVMMQASIAMLGKANQLPSILLDLLKNS
jgi:flagellin